MSSLTEKNSRLYYVDKKVVIMDYPYNGTGPVIILRRPTDKPTGKDWKSLNKALNLCGMVLKGVPQVRSDGFWYHPVSLGLLDLKGGEDGR